MSRKKLRIRPLAYLYNLDDAPANANPMTAQWPSMNVMVSSKRIERRWDTELYRTFDDVDTIQGVAIFRTNLGTYYTLVLTGTDLNKIMGGTNETYQHLTDTYTTGTIASITTTAVVGSSTNWNSSGLAAGDKFITNGDHSAAIEPDANWATIAAIVDDTHITLSSAYTGATTTGNYKARKVHNVPTGERWQWASVNGKFCYVNSNSYGQYWNGTDTYSTNLNATYCNQARYCVAYANRLFTADMYDSDLTARNPWLIRWSKEGDPTDWTDSTAGFLEFIDSEEPITGLGVAGANLVVFKKTAYYLGYRTGDPASPVAFPTNKRGVGLYAPYSLVHVQGTVAWMGLTDFYYLNADTAESIGAPIRKKFFELVADDELENVFGLNNSRYNEILWVANTSAGQYVFVYNYVEKSWSTYSFSNNITGLGGAGV
jgi:hypothetical protein